MSLTNVTLLDTSSSSLDVPEPPLEGTVGPSGGTRSRGPPAPVPELPPRTRRARVSTSAPREPVAEDEEGSDSGSSAGRSATPGPPPQLDYVQISRALALEARETRDENARLREQIRALRVSQNALTLCPSTVLVPNRRFAPLLRHSGLVVEPSMDPLRDLVFMAHTAAPFSFVSPSMDTYRWLLVSPTLFSTALLPLLLLLRQPHCDSSFPASSYSALFSSSTSAH